MIDEGDIGGYPILQYRKKNWQIPKYRVENWWNTDTVFVMGHAYLKLYPSRMLFYLKNVNTKNQPQPLRENARRSQMIDQYNDRKARSLDVLPISLYCRLTVRNCVIIYH